MKYKYAGDVPAILTEFHIEVNPGDVVDVGQPINNGLFIPHEEKKSASTKEAAN